MSLLTSFNSGYIKSPEGVLAIVIKAATTSDAEQSIYLPPNQLAELIFALSSCYRSLQKMYLEDPEGIKEKVIADGKTLNANVPVFTHDELHNPKIELRVNDFVLKNKDDRAALLFFLQNGSVLTIEFSLTQVEYLLTLLITTIKSTEDNNLAFLCLSTNDFIPLYCVNFINPEGEGIKYQQFSVPSWKAEVYECFYSIIGQQHDGNVTCGVIIKTDAGLEQARAENIGQILVQNNSLLSAYKDKIAKFDCRLLNISAGEESLERLLRAHVEHRTQAMN